MKKTKVLTIFVFYRSVIEQPFLRHVDIKPGASVSVSEEISFFPSPYMLLVLCCGFSSAISTTALERVYIFNKSMFTVVKKAKARKI